MIDVGIAHNFWVEAINTACYLTNRFLVRSILNKTPYELMAKRNPKLSYFKPFYYNCFLLNNDKEDLRKFNPRSYEGIFVRYSSTSKAYRIYNKST